MKGSISDKEKELLENSVPDMSNVPECLILQVLYQIKK
jgi:hypothetical protein